MTAQLMSSNGTVTFDVSTGEVLETEGYGWDEDAQYIASIETVDVDEWRRRYPGEDIAGQLDILDFGYWYRSDGVRKYEEPCKAWRQEREELRAEEAEYDA